MYRMMSYSINFEDVILQRAFPEGHRGFFIDIGAAHPIEQSDTKHFSNTGWRGINVEPNPSQFAAIVADRPRDINLNIGVSDRSGELSLFEAPGEACWSADRSFLTGYYAAGAGEIIEHKVPVLSLAEVCDRYVPEGQVIDFLKIDVEGHEGAVIAGGDWHRHRPRVVLAEATGSSDWDGRLRAVGYHFTLFDGVNRFYVRDEDRHLIPPMSVPANIGDAFGIHGYVSIIHQFGHRISQLEEEKAHLAGTLQKYKDDVLRHAVVAAAERVDRRYPRAARLARRVARTLNLRRGA